MLTEIGAENNTTTLIMMPSDFITLAKQWTEVLGNTNKAQTQAIQQNNSLNSEPVQEGVPFNLPSTKKLEI